MILGYNPYAIGSWIARCTHNTQASASATFAAGAHVTLRKAALACLGDISAGATLTRCLDRDAEAQDGAAFGMLV